MDKKKLILIAAAGLLATKPVLSTASEVDARIDEALSNARAEVRVEQPVTVDTADEKAADETPAQIY